MLLKQLLTKTINENSGNNDVVNFHINNEKAYTHVMDKFGHVISWNDDTMSVPRKFWGSIQELAYAAGGEAEEEENISSEEEGPIEAYGYAYNSRDQRVNWRKEFKNGEAAYAWAEKKNATILGTRPAGINENTLEESASLETTLRNIINDTGEPVTAMYDQLKFMAKKYVRDHGELDRGWKMVAQGAGARWIQSFYEGRLKNELYHLTKYNTKNTVELQQFLRGREVGGKLELKRSFFNIAKELPPILEKIGNKLNISQLARTAARWTENNESYQNYLDNLVDSDEVVPGDKKHNAQRMADKDQKHTQGKQFDQVEQIVNSVLSKLPSSIAGDIRNAIARSPNKLQALQSELSKRNVQVQENNADTKIGGRYAPAEFDAKLARMKAQHQKKPTDIKDLAARMQAAYKKDDQKVSEKMLPKSAFAGSDKNKLGSAGQLKGSMKRPARAGDLVGGMEEGKKPEHNLGTGWMLDKDKQLGQKVTQNKAKARQEKDTMQKYAGKKVGEEKKKGADGKACWDGYRYNGTENGKDKCVPVSEDVENIMGALIENLLRK